MLLIYFLWLAGLLSGEGKTYSFIKHWWARTVCVCVCVLELEDGGENLGENKQGQFKVASVLWS